MDLSTNPLIRLLIARNSYTNHQIPGKNHHIRDLFVHLNLVLPLSPLWSSNSHRFEAFDNSSSGTYMNDIDMLPWVSVSLFPYNYYCCDKKLIGWINLWIILLSKEPMLYLLSSKKMRQWAVTNLQCPQVMIHPSKQIRWQSSISLLSFVQSILCSTFYLHLTCQTLLSTAWQIIQIHPPTLICCYKFIRG